MFFISKYKVCKLLLQEMNEARASYEQTAKEARAAHDEQRERDAFMLYSGYVSVAYRILTKIEGVKKRGKESRKRS